MLYLGSAVNNEVSFAEALDEKFDVVGMMPCAIDYKKLLRDMRIGHIRIIQSLTRGLVMPQRWLLLAIWHING